MSAIRERFAVDTIRLAPKGLFSEVVGWGARRTVPRRLRGPVHTAFARAVGARLDEVELPLEEYPTLASFFSRRLRHDARPVASERGAVVSPCDGTVASAGTAEAGRLLQAKGRDYSLRDLVVDPGVAVAVTGGPYLCIYLSPKDYHRVHTPCAAQLLGFDYVPGTLFPVSPRWAGRIPDLFARNERLIFHLKTPYGLVGLVMVGAVGVGNITLAREAISTRIYRRQGEPQSVRYETPLPLSAGDELGSFELGSTVVLLFPPGPVELAGLEPGAGLRLGQRIATGKAPEQEGAAA
jgi:phosphatidylserine decarboxylase